MSKRGFLHPLRFQRVVHAICIPVEVLRVVGSLYDDVGREHSAYERVVHAAVLIDEAKVVEVLVGGEAAGEKRSVVGGAIPR